MKPIHHNGLEGDLWINCNKHPKLDFKKQNRLNKLFTTELKTDDSLHIKIF